MTHVAKIRSLTGDLIESIQGFPKVLTEEQDTSDLERLKLFASRHFSDLRPARINQFEVSNQLYGLEEKFRVLNNDELADALQARLDELSALSDRWTPEVLSLLLRLSDKPVERTRIEDIAVPELESSEPLLQWSDILADESLNNSDGIWDSIDYAADSSDEDEIIALEISSTPELTPDSNIQLDDAHADVDSDIQTVQIDNEAFTETINSQFWKSKAAPELSSADYSIRDKEQLFKVMITEVQMIREIIFMLLSLPTSVFTPTKDGDFVYSSRYSIRHVSDSSIKHLLTTFVTLGKKLSRIRNWTRRIECVPVQQTFQAVLSSRMRDVNNALSAIEARIINPVRATTISLLDLSGEVSHITRYMLPIAEVIAILESTPEEQRPFEILEGLFDRTCTYQSLGDAEGYEYMAQLFFICLQTYMKPVRTWMETGDLSKHDKVMFIVRNEHDVALDSLWQTQYSLRCNANGRLHAPEFLHVAAKKIFTTGKSVNFLKKLGHGPDQNKEVFQLDYPTVCGVADEDMFSHFSVLLDMALDSWIASMHHSSSQILRNQLESQCGLSRSLDALEHIYFHRNGALSDAAISIIFDRLDRGNRAWNDSSILTEHFRSVFVPLSCIDPDRLGVRSTLTPYRGTKNYKRSVKFLCTLRITYMIPWPLATIIPTSSLSTYQAIFTFLLQTHCAAHLLLRHPFLFFSASSWNPRSTQNTLTLSLRHRLLWFTNILLTYLTEIVLAVSTVEMRAAMSRAEDVDAMIAVHESYIRRLEEQCLISKRLTPIHQAVISLLDLAVLFTGTHAAHTNPNPKSHIHTQQRKISRIAASDGESSSSEDPSGSDNEEAEFSFTTPYEDQLRKMHDTYTKLLAFVTAGLRGVSRAGGEACWEILAEKLGG